MHFYYKKKKLHNVHNDIEIEREKENYTYNMKKRILSHTECVSLCAWIPGSLFALISSSILIRTLVPCKEKLSEPKCTWHVAERICGENTFLNSTFFFSRKSCILYGVAEIGRNTHTMLLYAVSLLSQGLLHFFGLLWLLEMDFVCVTKTNFVFI